MLTYLTHFKLTGIPLVDNMVDNRQKSERLWQLIPSQLTVMWWLLRWGLGN